MSKRDWETLINGFEDIKKLYQYLYADESHSISVKNVIDTELTIKMNDSLGLTASTGNSSFEFENNLENLLSAIALLKEQPSESGRFKSQWEEITMAVGVLRVLNNPKDKKNRVLDNEIS